MAAQSSNLKGIALMCASMAVFIVNDTIIKSITQELPPFETLFLRGIATMIVGLPLLFATGQIRALPKVLERRVLMRNTLEAISILGYIIGLAYAPIADLNALGQLAPVLMTLAAVWFLGARIGRLEMGLIVLAFVGALLVARPGASGFTVFALFGLWNAVLSATRDLVGRTISADIPGMIVPIGGGLTVMVIAGIAHFATEAFVMPDLRLVGMMFAAALFLTLGHLCIFLAFRHGTVSAVAPFLYTSTIWALIAGYVVFRTLPDWIGFAGIGLILVCGVSIVVLEGRKARVGPTGTA